MSNLTANKSAKLEASWLVWYDSLNNKYFAKNGLSGFVEYDSSSGVSGIINSIITAKMSSRGGKIYLRPATLHLEAPILIDKPDVIIEGSGWDDTQLYSNDYGDSMIKITADRCQLRHLSLNGVKSIQTSGSFSDVSGSVYITSNNVYLDDIYIYNCTGSYTVYISGSADLEIRNCTIGHFGGTAPNFGHGLYIESGSSNCRVTNSSFIYNSGSNFDDAGAIVVNGLDHSITNCHFYANNYHVIVAPKGVTRKLLIANNEFRYSMKEAIIKTSSQIFSDSVISSNCFYFSGRKTADSYDSIYLTGAATKSMAITGNVFDGRSDTSLTHTTRYAIQDCNTLSGSVFSSNAIHGMVQATGYSITLDGNQTGSNAILGD